MKKDARIYIAGHRGMVGSALVRLLQGQGFTNIITRSSAELDLREQNLVRDFFHQNQPEYVFLAAAKVGGILANQSYPADFLYDNLAIEANVIHNAYVHGVEKLLFLGSSCIYPKMAPQPMSEDALLTGPLEPTNEAYALAKIAGIKLCEAYRDQHGCNFIAAMPTNLYGPNDNYDLQKSHVLPALIRKFHEAKIQGSPTVNIWGDGSPLRELMHVDDLARACLFLMENYDGRQFVNIGSGQEISIKDLALLVQKIVGFDGDLDFDPTKPNGTPRKRLDNSLLESLGFQTTISLEEGIAQVYADFQKNQDRYVKGENRVA